MGRLQFFMIFGLVAFFVLFDFSFYNIVTKRFVRNADKGMQAKSIELDKYLPFDDNSKIVYEKSAFQIEGDIPVLDGATALYPVFSAIAAATYPESSVHFDGANFTSESKLQMNNTIGAYKAVVDGNSDIVFCASPSKEQLAYAAERGVQLELVPIGRESFVFIVNKNNPITELSIEQVRGIYSGKHTNWREVGGDNSPIANWQRNVGSGSQTAMLKFMGDEEIKANSSALLFGRAIGFSFRYYVSDVVANGGVKMIALNGIYPSVENIRNGSYPITSNFFAVYRSDNPNPNIRRLVEWILSEEGQRIVEWNGYAPM